MAPGCKYLRAQADKVESSRTNVDPLVLVLFQLDTLDPKLSSFVTLGKIAYSNLRKEGYASGELLNMATPDQDQQVGRT